MAFSSAHPLKLIIAIALLAAAVGRAQSSPSQFDTVAAQAAAARDQKNVPLALELYGKAVQLKPDWAEGWWNLGLIHYVANQYEPAIEAFNQLLELEPRTVPAIEIGRASCRERV